LSSIEAAAVAAAQRSASAVGGRSSEERQEAYFLLFFLCYQLFIFDPWNRPPQELRGLENCGWVEGKGDGWRGRRSK
jgi:hypothetical protein